MWARGVGKKDLVDMLSLDPAWKQGEGMLYPEWSCFFIFFNWLRAN